jgi:hypothetical protein
VILLNDLESPWRGEVTFILRRGEEIVFEQKQAATVDEYGSTRTAFTVVIPQSPGDYQLEAVLSETPCGPVHSLRDFAVK